MGRKAARDITHTGPFERRCRHSTAPVRR